MPITFTLTHKLTMLILDTSVGLEMDFVFVKKIFRDEYHYGRIARNDRHPPDGAFGFEIDDGFHDIRRKMLETSLFFF